MTPTTTPRPWVLRASPPHHHQQQPAQTAAVDMQDAAGALAAQFLPQGWAVDELLQFSDYETVDKASLPQPPARLPKKEKRGVKEREMRKGKREEADVATLTCGAHVGPMLTQQPRRTKPGSIPSRDLL
uniref:Uncharacterized protein n=1 Tax=Oryza glumipatula TaxID=40148 RepID=A0A0D9ZXT9_9ORYZ